MLIRQVRQRRWNAWVLSSAKMLDRITNRTAPSIITTTATIIPSSTWGIRCCLKRSPRKMTRHMQAAAAAAAVAALVSLHFVSEVAAFAPQFHPTAPLFAPSSSAVPPPRQQQALVTTPRTTGTCSILRSLSPERIYLETSVKDSAKTTPLSILWDRHPPRFGASLATSVASVALGLSVWSGTLLGGVLPFSDGSGPPLANAASSDIVGCLFQKCPLPLAQCIADPRCLANVVCIQTCTGRPDEIACQIKCGDLVGESNAIANFNKCVVSDMTCVPQQPDEGLYPVPSPEIVVPKFDTKFFNGRLYITAGTCGLCDRWLRPAILAGTVEYSSNLFCCPL
jgi:VDE lipocalin domain